MNLNNGEEKEFDVFFTQHCLELANLLRTDQTEAFLHLYDSLPSEWIGSRLEAAKATIREYQDLDENDFQSLYQRAFNNNMSKQSLNDQVHSLSLKKTNDDNNRRVPSTTNNRTCTAVDSFVQLNLKPDINIRLEDYKKAIDTMPLTKNNTANNRFHQDASFDYFSPHEQHSRSSSSSSSSTTTTNPQKPIYKHGKLIENHDFDSHGSSITTKSSSENSESIRTASGSDSDEGEKKPLLANTTKPKLYSTERTRNYDDTLTLVLNQTSDHQTSQHDLKSTLPEQNSYELVKSPTSNDSLSLRQQMPRFKQPANDDPNGFNHSNNDLLSYTTQRSQLNNPSILSSSHQTRNSEHHEQYNTNHHSNSSRKSATRAGKKRKQLQQQEIIRTELIPGHRGDLDVDELVMFIDGGHTSIKQRQNSSSQRTFEINSNQTNSSTSKRKSRKSSKILQDNETKISNYDDDNDNNNNIHFVNEHDQNNTNEIHSFDEQINPDDDDESHSNTTNGEISLPEWHNTSSNNDEFDSLSLSSLTLNNSNSEIISEPFVTVTHRRRSIKERRQETNNNNNNRTARFSDKRRFQPTQNGLNRSTISNSKSSIPISKEQEEEEEEEEKEKQQQQQSASISLPLLPPPLPSVPSTENPAVIQPAPLSSSISEQTSPRLSSHSSSSSLSSLLKRQSKVAPPVVFLNKSIDVELNDVSFGFDMETSATDKPSTPTPTSPPSPLPTPLTSEPSVDKDNYHSSTNKRSYPQKNIRSQPFHSSNTDTRPHQQRNYSSQSSSSSSYVDPYLLLQYNQQRYQQLAYMNYFRAQYLPSQSSYVLIPTVPSSSSFEPNSDNKDSPNEQIHEPLFVYTGLPGQNQPIYYPTNKKSMYPSQYFYPATHPAYFQPISTSSVIDNKSQQDDTDHDDLLDDDEIEHDYEKSSTHLFHQTQTSTSSSSHIMSNALQLVYSQEKFNAQTDRFNLDQITAYLAMKWTETVDLYKKGDNEILLTSE